MRLPGCQAESLLPQVVLIPDRARLKFDRLFDRLKDKVNTLSVVYRMSSSLCTN